MIYRCDLLPVPSYLSRCLSAFAKIPHETTAGYANMLDCSFLGDKTTTIRQYLAAEGLAAVTEPSAWPLPVLEVAPQFKLKLRAIGFCGIDESVPDPAVALPALLAKLPAEVAAAVEWGVLIKPGSEGEPRIPAMPWVERLAAVAAAAPPGKRLRLAAHLCGTAADELLQGPEPQLGRVQALAALGFDRVQLNPTAINGSKPPPAGAWSRLVAVAAALPAVEFILQANEETAPLWEGLIGQLVELPATATATGAATAGRVSVLYDASMGRGQRDGRKPQPPHPLVPCGFAGGLGPDNLRPALLGLAAANGPREPACWVDMESGVRRWRPDGGGGGGGGGGSDDAGFDLGKVETCLLELAALVEDGVVALVLPPPVPARADL
eukprot:SAG22_NODE_45_length_24718_cov_12.462448_3_plen_381_part_00